jgi:predicted nucleic acid-binding protein
MSGTTLPSGGNHRSPALRRGLAFRADLTVYDAAYIAVAERVGATLVTLDRRIAGSPGVGCPVAAPAAD